MMELAKFWIPILGGGVFFSWGLSAYYGGSKPLGIWLICGGVISLVILGAIQWQDHLSETKPVEQPTEAEIAANRAYADISFAAVLLNSPGPGHVTAWIRIKNTGKTRADSLRGWMLFHRRPSGDAPFNEVRAFENDVILGANQESNMSGTLSVTDAELRAVIEEKHSFFVWGRVEYRDMYGRERFHEFKGRMNGPPSTVVVDGVRAEGWGFKPIAGGDRAN